MQNIKIDGIEQKDVQFGKKITLFSGKEKFSFFDKKKDNTNTKAYDQFKKYRYQIGDIVSAEVKEEEKSFVNEDNKSINFTQRTILFFEEKDNIPVVEIKKGKTLTIEERLTRLEKSVFPEGSI